MPFDQRYTLPLEATPTMPFFQRHYWAQRGADLEAARLDATQGWRRIDADWLGGATELALKLDADTNNTSRVLAIELSKPDQDGPVLLFAADAQVGKWLSWRNLEWKNYHGRRITGPDLLRRTIVYRVGHHASHNATLRELGLEMMTPLELALVPTDSATADKVDWGTLPWKPLLDALGEKAAERVIRTDAQLPKAGAGFIVRTRRLYYEVVLQ